MESEIKSKVTDMIRDMNEAEVHVNSLLSHTGPKDALLTGPVAVRAFLLLGMLICMLVLYLAV